MHYTYDDIININISDVIINSDTIQKIIDIKKKLNITDTIIEKKPKNEPTHTNNICKLLNKISEKNYDKLKKEIIELIHTIKNDSDMLLITNKIFLIASSNRNLCELYSKLYKELIHINNDFLFIFQDNFSTYIEILKTIHYVSCNENYDLYCDYVKKVDKLISSLYFFISLMKLKICTIDNIIILLENLINTLKNELNNETSSNEYKEELMNSIFIIFKESIHNMKLNKKYPQIQEEIQYIKTNNNISKKIKFKCMDIEDIMNDKN